MKRVLIISPYFPPTNAADMQRIRMSLPYFGEFGWNVEIVTVDPVYSEINLDDGLKSSIPQKTVIHYVRAFDKKWTQIVGLGSIALRSFLFYKRKVNQLLKGHKYDLIYFSTTQFPLCVLGRYWKKKFSVPYVIDMQDPWLSDYYTNKPASQRPKKYWFSHRLNKWLEPKAMNMVDGLISVSGGYLKTLSDRYSNCRRIPQQVITFGASSKDIEIAASHEKLYPSVLNNNESKINIVYIGRGGYDMLKAVRLLFESFKEGLKLAPQLFSNMHFYFIGTSYAPDSKGKYTFSPLASEMGIAEYVTEQTDRLPFYQVINTLKKANALFIPGSDDAQYTASKLYPYVQVAKPVLAIFHPESNANYFLKACGVATVISLYDNPENCRNRISDFLIKVANGEVVEVYPVQDIWKEYSAERMTEKQCKLFDQIVA